MSMHDAKTCYNVYERKSHYRSYIMYPSLTGSGDTLWTRMTWTQTGSRLANPDPCLVLICKRVIMSAVFG